MAYWKFERLTKCAFSLSLLPTAFQDLFSYGGGTFSPHSLGIPDNKHETKTVTKYERINSYSVGDMILLSYSPQEGNESSHLDIIPGNHA